VTALLDVNALVALAWPNHVHHGAAVDWFIAASHEGWATCPVTESGFVRVSSNRKANPSASSVGDAVRVLQQLRAQPGHHFWPDDVSIATCTEVDVAKLAGYRQVTDAHLLAVALRNQGRLVTFDKAIRTLGSADAVVVLTL